VCLAALAFGFHQYGLYNSEVVDMVVLDFSFTISFFDIALFS